MRFWLNGSATREAYVERKDNIYINDHKLNFDPYDLSEATERHFDHPLLKEQNLVGSELKILIEGETGTGKTHLASRIHEKSGRLGKFVAVNLSSFNPNLIESELFGHKKGSFTGALQDKKGAFEESQEGTLFLDEIDSLPWELQTKLLTFLDSNKFRRVGDTQELKIKSRLIFASGRSLDALVRTGKVRRDFYFRLMSGHSVKLSSLREDSKKIKEACQFYALKNAVSFSESLMNFYETLPWPGNLRQLYGHLEKKRILTNSTKLDFDSYDEFLLQESSDLMSLSDSQELLPMKDFKEEYVKKALVRFGGNVSLTARKLKVTEKTVKAILQRSS